MVVDTGTAILILGAFVLPGFITLTLRERLYVVRGEEAPFERLLSALLYSAIIYGVLLVAAHGLGLQKSDLVEFQAGEKPLGDDLLAAVAILMVLPGLIAVSGSRWMASSRIRPWVLHLAGSSEAHGTASAWNQLVSKQRSCLVRVALSDGRIMGGLFDESSAVGYSEQIPDLYLSQRWEFDGEGWFVGPTDRTLGVWIASECIASLEIYELDGAVNLERESPKIRS
jgi:Family of unknown function (DUF6338)